MTAPEISGQGHKPGTATDEHTPPPSQQPETTPVPDPESEPNKKRRRIAKPNADKKFECRHEGCGKSYSRAEHLYRHQLNHTPKNIYHCDFPDCNRYFVRQDLCVRHRDRHTTAGSQLHKRDAFAHASQGQTKGSLDSTSPTDFDDKSTFAKPAQPQTMLGSTSQAHSQFTSNNAPYQASGPVHPTDQQNPSSSILSPQSDMVDARYMPPTPTNGTNRNSFISARSNSFGNNPLSPDQTGHGNSWQQRRDSLGHPVHAPAMAQAMSQSVPQSPSRTYSNSSGTTHPLPTFRTGSDLYMSNSDQNGVYHHNTVPSSSTGPNHFRTPELPRQSQDAFSAALSHGLNPSHTDPYLYSQIHTTNSGYDMNSAYGYPIFGADDYSRSPFLLNDEFTAWLFNPNVAEQPNLSPDVISGTYADNSTSQYSDVNTMGSDAVSVAHGNQTQTHPKMSVHSVLDSSQPSNYIMSENKRQELLDLMQMQFVERTHDAVKKRKAMVFEGDPDADGHILSLRMMHTYIGSYWYHQHAQLPILHKPTFSADKTPTLLLLAVIAIGAATMDKAYGTALTDSAAEFANFIVWHLRWEIIRDIDYRPPAKLWVFQTLLLIEVYEKMYSTRTLHERAHIHHDSTLTLMRRGSSLIGRSASETPPSLVEERGRGVNGTANGMNDGSDEAWLKWIATEATRRAAFGAFVLDSLHCTMFGHSAKMVAHEMRLPLPCDEALWSATSPQEVGRVQASLRTNGVKPIMFLEGLKRTLNGATVRTNSFGRSIIMAGLLSVSHHMTQRDLQIASIGPRAANSIGGPDKWKGTLLRAFDNWKRDFDEALAESAATAPLTPPRISASPTNTASLLRPVDDENIFETRTVLHHLAHIAAHVDIVDCQVFAGANRLLSRSVTPRDYSLIRDKIEKWATRASARDSAFYALKFITTVLIPPGANSASDSIDSRIYGHASPILPQAYDSDRYIARDDFLLNRPWVLYVSALVVWCYGFALEGPITPTPKDSDFATYEQREKDMREYLDRVAGVRAPDDLEKVEGKNRCLGLLLILQESFESTRWELTHEAAGLLGNAAARLKGIGVDTQPDLPLVVPPRATWDADADAGGQGQMHAQAQANGLNGMNGHAMAIREYGSTVSAFNTARP